MAKGDIVRVSFRKETPAESSLADWFEKQTAGDMDALETGARQVLQLVTAFYSVIFGAVALGQQTFAASLKMPLVIGLGVGAILAMLAALVAALIVVMPFGARYRPASLTDQKNVYRGMLARKAIALTVAGVTFGVGLAAFAGLTVAMLYYR
jgi:hypothetical protein